MINSSVGEFHPHITKCDLLEFIDFLQKDIAVGRDMKFNLRISKDSVSVQI